MTGVQMRRGTTAQWAAPTQGNPDEGELVYNTETKTAKVGDGTAAFADLPGLGGPGGGSTTLADLGVTAAAAELNFTDGVTAPIQGQLDGKQPADPDLTTWASKAAPSGAVVGTTDTQTLTNKTLGAGCSALLSDANFGLTDDGDATRRAFFQASGIAANTDRVYTLPDGSGTLALRSDTAPLDRANHTGQQSSSTIADLPEAVQDIVAGFLAQGTGVTVTYDDAGNTLTVAATGGGGSTDPEVVRDTIGVALAGLGLISVTVNDAADTITITTTATANDTDANLKNRQNHTGQQSADSLLDGDTIKAFTAAERTKLAGIEVGADVTDAANVAAAGAFMAANVVDEDDMASDSAAKVPTQQSVKAYIAARIAALIASAPGALDTLDELAAALGDDANFATTVTNALAGKQPVDPTLTAFAGLVTSANKLIYATAADTFATADLTAAGRALLDDADAAAQRVTLGVGTKRVNSAASNATPVLDGAYDATVLTAQAAAITAFSLANMTAERAHMVRIKDSGTARAITWTSSVIVPADGITLPTTTVVGKTHRISAIYDEVVGKLIAHAVATY